MESDAAEVKRRRYRSIDEVMNSDGDEGKRNCYRTIRDIMHFDSPEVKRGRYRSIDDVMNSDGQQVAKGNRYRTIEDSIIHSDDDWEAEGKHYRAIMDIINSRGPVSFYDSGGVESHGALVTYKAEFGKIVPYVGKVKRKRHRAKVDKGKENFLDEDTKTLQELAYEFIEHVRPVQGHRRPTFWKGSVLSSVVGAFLTKNVSDHFSSSAYMSLGAKFPTKSEVSGKPANMMFHTTLRANGGCSGPPSFTLEDFVGRNIPIDTVSASCVQLLRMQELICMSNDEVGSSEYHEIPAPCQEGSMLNEVLNLRSKHQAPHASASINMPNCTSISITYGKLLRMQELKRNPIEIIGSSDHQGEPTTYVSDVEESIYTGLNRTVESSVTQAERIFDYPPSSIFCERNLPFSPGNASKNETKMTDSLTALLCCIDPSLSQVNVRFPSVPTLGAHSVSSIANKHLEPLLSSEPLSLSREWSSCEKHLPRNKAEATFVKQHGSLNLHVGCTNRTISRQNQKAHYDSQHAIFSDWIQKSEDTEKALPEAPGVGSKVKKKRGVTSKKRTYDFEAMRKEVLCKLGNKECNSAEDKLDWEAIRQADVKEISETIKKRGMSNMLAKRIKELLNRLVRDHGSTDIEWLHHVDPEIVKDYLLSIKGLGLKSVECVRLLTLHQMAFPVDTNVGRICVRLGWVPLQPLPESLQLHLLELYPVLESIYNYLWPRLCKLDQETLYALHYQMITFGKVFCTKTKPNCNACPMRARCRHFASAFSSAKLALPEPEEKSAVTMRTPIAAESCHQPDVSLRSVNQLGWGAHAPVLDNHQLIVEEPANPETQQDTMPDMEDFFYDAHGEPPVIKVSSERSVKQNLKNYMQANNIDVEDADIIRNIADTTPEDASIPTPKIKNVGRLRTEHQVYELPDTSPLLEGFDKREPDDPHLYLFLITPGETAQSSDTAKTVCNPQDSTESNSCFGCKSIRAHDKKVKGTLLIPCRTATKGNFPLNGTYFQVNEVFADYASSLHPIDVPSVWINQLPRRTVYFGTSISTIFKGLETKVIQECFSRGYVCLRAVDRKTGAPRPLSAMIHFPAMKIIRKEKGSAGRDDTTLL